MRVTSLNQRTLSNFPALRQRIAQLRQTPEFTPALSLPGPKEVLDANEAPWLCGFVPRDQGLKNYHRQASDIPNLRYSSITFVTVITKVTSVTRTGEEAGPTPAVM